MESALSGLDSLVTFRNSQGAEARGTVMHLTRETVVFEVYNPYSVVQTSEVLRDLRVLRGERTIYTGHAVVSSIVSTGVMLIVCATLVDGWSDLVGVPPGEALRAEVRNFIRDWEASHDIRPSYQLAVGNVTSFLAELNRWLNQVETASGRGESQPVQREFTLEVAASVDEKLSSLFGRFEQEAAQVPPEEVSGHKAFVRRQVHPLMLVSPFIHRTYTKPLGYAGDYEMVNMILRDPLEGPNTYAKVLNSMILRSDGAQAHRNRIERLIQYLKSEARRVTATGRKLQVLNIGCGPAGEIQQFIRTEPLADRCEFYLMDFNAETLAYTRRCIEDASRQSGRRPTVHYVHKSINELLKDAARGAAGRGAGAAFSAADGGDALRFVSADLVYCAGLFDYLSDKVCKRLVLLFYTWVSPGGLVAVTNVHPRNSVRYFLEHVLEWHLIYRDEKQMNDLACAGGTKTVNTDPTGVNVFLEIRKPTET